MEDIQQGEEKKGGNNLFMSIGVALALIVLISFFFIYQKKDSTNEIKILREDGVVVWSVLPVGGLNIEDTKKGIESYKNDLENVFDQKDRYDVLLNLARLYENFGDGKSAFETLNDAIVLWPERSLAYMNMGDLLFKMKANVSAENAYLRGLSKEPQFYFNHLSLISFYIKSGAISEKVENAFTKALSDTGEDTNILIEYAQWLEEGNVPKAIEIWERVLALNPANAPAIKANIEKLKKKL